MSEQQRRDTADRTGEYGGGDGALEHERATSGSSEGPGSTNIPTEQAPQAGKTQAERKQDRDLASGAENPG